jgi:hypothetical protein
MATYPFLSDDWFAAAAALLADEPVVAPEALESVDLVVDATVTGTPFGADRELHLGHRHGEPVWGLGRAEQADVTIVTDYATARDLFLGSDPQAVLSAFLLGKLVVSGDIGALVARVQPDMAGLGAGAMPIPTSLVARLKDITE